MSEKLIDKIKKYKKVYLYEKITYFIKHDESETKLSKCEKSSRTNMFNNIIEAMEKFTNKNGIPFKKSDINNLNKIFNNFNKIINWHNQNLNKNDKRKEHLTILKNILFTKKDKDIISNFDLDDGKVNENIFDKNDFIFHYSLNAIQIIFNERFTKEEYDKLNNIYLHLIFQVNAPEFIKKLKILTYNYLYNNNINQFINKSSEYIGKSLEYIVNNEKKSDLKKLKEEIGEFDYIDIIENVPCNVKAFFTGETTETDKDKINKLLDFFTLKNIKSNYKKIESQEILKENIVIDDLKFKQNKLHLFSPEFLISNGLKSKIELCDFEIFNDNNYSVDIFAEFLNEIILKINDSIKENNFSNDYMEKNLIKLHKMELIHYISAKLGYEHINEIRDLINKSIDKKTNNNNKNIDKKTKDFIHININKKIDNNKNGSGGEKKDKNNNNNKINYFKSKTKNIIVNINEPENEEEEEEEVEKKGEIDNNTSNKNNISESYNISILSKSLLSDYNKKYSEFFENMIYQRLVKNIDKSELILLPNILYMLNFKIPVINNEENTLKFKSIHLDTFNPNKKYVNNNYYYGCKEIDTIFRNESEKSYEISDSHLFKTNLTYVRKKGEKNFCLEENKEFSIGINSILFFEIKKSFPNRSSGDQNILTAKVGEFEQNPNLSKNSMSEDNPLYAYYEQIIKLIKKFKYFFHTFEAQINKEKGLNIHIALIYDTYNVNEKEDIFEEIKKWTSQILYSYGWRINNDLGTTIFQLVFFDKMEFDKSADKLLDKKDTENTQLKEKDKIISAQKAQLDEIKKINDNPNLTEDERRQKTNEILNRELK